MFEIDEQYLCKACKRINTEPYQSSCGCRFCERCINVHEICQDCKKSTWPYLKVEAIKNESTKCNICDWSGNILDISQHCHEEHVTKDRRNIYLNSCLSKTEVQINDIKPIIDTIKSKLIQTKADNERIKRELGRTQNELEAIQSNLIKTQKMWAYLAERLSSIENSSKNGILIWKITDFMDKFSAATAGSQTNFYSQPFYTSEYGYKLCARVYLNGDGPARGTHLSLFVVMMKGAYDNLLRWPFRQKITFTLLDQSGKEKVTDSFRADPRSRSFAKPVNELNVAAGIPLFCPHSRLFSEEFEYIKDNCLFIKIIVDTDDLIEL